MFAKKKKKLKKKKVVVADYNPFPTKKLYGCSTRTRNKGTQMWLGIIVHFTTVVALAYNYISKLSEVAHASGVEHIPLPTIRTIRF